MGAASLILAAVSTAVTVVGTIQAAQTASAQAEYDAQVAANNAIIAEREAADARERGEIEAREREKLTELELGTARAGAAGRGVEVDTGSASDITADIAAAGALDALTIRANAEREALRSEQTAADFTSESELLEIEADTAQTEGFLGATGDLLSGGAVVADKWTDFKGS